MNNEDGNNESKVKTDNNSIAIGGINIGGDISGTIQIGHTTGYTPEEVSVLITQIQSTFQPKPFDGRCPYKGLDVFDEEDAELFFGREKLVDDLVNRIKDSRTVFVTGPSGSGKSSLVRAGLMHALKQGVLKGSDRWLYATIKPGRDLLESLANAFSRLKSPELGNYFRQHADQVKVLHECAESALTENKNQRLILFIDQFEEVFTQISKEEEERVAFLNLLTHAATVANGRVIILFSMRSDFVSNCATYPKLNSLLNQQFVQIGAMQPEELVSAIAQPALRVGLRIDPDLIAQIINEMKGEPGALPLMQFALKDLFDSQREKSGVISLTLNDYLQRGGIHKALERHADDSFSKLSKNEQELARSIFSGLIEIGRGTEDTKRTALFDELIPANANAEDVEAIVQKLADARLITTDEAAGKDTITISHEKLIDAWPWLKKLVNENRDVITLQNQISADAKEWQERKRDASYLYTGGRLASVREQLEKQKIGLGQLGQEFIRAGQARQRRTQSFLISAVSVVLIAAIAASVIFQNQARQNIEIANTAQAASTFAIAQQATAQANAEEAQRQAKIARAGELAARSTEMRDGNFSLSLLLGIEAFRLFDNVQTRGTLLDGAGANPQLKQFITRRRSDTLMQLDYLTNVAFSPNSGITAVENRHTIDILDMKTGQINCQIPMSNYGVGATSAFTPDGKILAAGAVFEIILWDVSTCQPIGQPLKRHSDIVTSLAFSPDGKTLASGSMDSTIILWDVTTRQPIGQPLSGHTDWVNSVTFSPDGKTLASGSMDSTIILWDVITLQPIGQRLSGHTDWVNSVTFSPDGKTLVAGSNDNSIILWDVATRQQIGQPFTKPNSLSESMAFSLDGNILALTGLDNTILLWNVATHQPIGQPLKGHQATVLGVTFNPDGKSLESVSKDGEIILWNLEMQPSIGKISTKDVGQINSISFSPNSKTLVSGSGNGAIVIWDANMIEPIGLSLTKNSEPVNAVAFSPDGNTIAAGNQDGITFWDETTRQPIGLSLENHTRTKSSIAFSPDGKNLAVSDGTLWNIDTHQIIGNLSEGDDVAFSPDGKILAIASGAISLWDIATLLPIGQPFGQDAFSIAFSPDGKILATGSVNSDGAISLWNVTTHQLIDQPLIGHSGPVATVAFSPDGKILATGGYDNVIILYDVLTHQSIGQPLIGHNSSITSIAFSPDGRTLASGSWDTKIILWDLDPQTWIRQSCQRAGANFTLTEWARYFPNEEYRKTCEQWPLESEAIAIPTTP